MSLDKDEIKLEALLQLTKNRLELDPTNKELLRDQRNYQKELDVVRLKMYHINKNNLKILKSEIK